MIPIQSWCLEEYPLMLVPARPAPYQINTAYRYRSLEETRPPALSSYHSHSNSDDISTGSCRHLLDLLELSAIHPLHE